MQNRSKRLAVTYAPVELDARLPIRVIPKFTKNDAPIRMLQVHNCLEIGFCHEGSGVLMAGEKVMPFATGDVSFVNHTEVHFSTSARGTTSRWSWVLLDPERLVPGAPTGLMDASAMAGPGFENIIRAEENGAPREIMTRLLDELEKRPAHWESATRALVWELMIVVRRLRRDAGEAPARGDYDRLAPALQIIASRHAEPLRVGELARRCGLSEPHFRRLFSATLGRSPQAYWLDLRLSMASSLLRTTSRSVLEVSEEVGFATLSGFNRLFVRRFGRAPREWRRGKADETEGGG